MRQDCFKNLAVLLEKSRFRDFLLPSKYSFDISSASFELAEPDPHFASRSYFVLAIS